MFLLKVFLASKSPRRKELLDQINIDYQVIPIDIDEGRHINEEVEHFISRLAYEKAYTGLNSVEYKQEKRPIIGADTVIVLDNNVIGKPKNQDEFFSMLSSLSGRAHRVLTAVSVCFEDWHKTCLVSTEVKFKEISTTEMIFYWDKYQPTDKAGGYGIQDYAGVFVEWIRGSYSGIVGLPLYETQQLLIDWLDYTKKSKFREKHGI